MRLSFHKLLTSSSEVSDLIFGRKGRDFPDGMHFTVLKRFGSWASRAVAPLAEVYGIPREHFYRARSSKRNPRLSTTLAFTKPAGIKLLLEERKRRTA
jgi:hypothetical protein